MPPFVAPPPFPSPCPCLNCRLASGPSLVAPKQVSPLQFVVGFPCRNYHNGVKNFEAVAPHVTLFLLGTPHAPLTACKPPTTIALYLPHSCSFHYATRRRDRAKCFKLFIENDFCISAPFVVVVVVSTYAMWQWPSISLQFGLHM